MRENILLVANSGFTIINFRSEFITDLQDKGFRVYVACPEDLELMNGINPQDEIKKLGAIFLPIKLIRNGLNPFNELISVISIFKALHAAKPKIVVNYTIKPTIYSSLACKILRIKEVFSNITGIGYVFTSMSFKSKLISAFIKIQYRLALGSNKKVFFQNYDDLKLFIEKGLIKKSKCVLINGSGVNLKKFKRSKEYPDTPSFLFIGRLLKSKGVLEYLKAARFLKEKYPMIHFSLLGDFDKNPSSLSREELEKYISLGSVNYLGSSNDVKSVLEDYSILVLPSYREGTPRSVLEAMSMSMPIVTTNAPGCKETVVNGLNGYLSKVGDHKNLSECMEKFILKPNLIKQFGDISRKIAQEKYDVHVVNKSIIQEMI